MGTGRIGLGQPAADDRHLAGPVSGLVPQQAREFGRQPGTIRVLRGRRLKLSGTVATTRKMLRRLTHFVRWLAWQLRPLK
jgi:hypothetical protein